MRFEWASFRRSRLVADFRVVAINYILGELEALKIQYLNAVDLLGPIGSS